MDKIKRIFFAQTTRDTLISFTGLGTIAVVGMLFTVIMARALEPALFGVFSALNALVGLLSSMGDLGISSALVNFIPISDKVIGQEEYDQSLYRSQYNKSYDISHLLVPDWRDGYFDPAPDGRRPDP